MADPARLHFYEYHTPAAVRVRCGGGGSERGFERAASHPRVSPVAHIYVDNWGWYLFKYIPVLTGDLNNPGVPRLPLLLTDNVRVDRLVEKVSQESQKRGGTIISDLRTRDRSYYMVWTLFFWLQEFEVSANASVLAEAAEQPGQ